MSREARDEQRYFFLRTFFAVVVFFFVAVLHFGFGLAVGFAVALAGFSAALLPGVHDCIAPAHRPPVLEIQSRTAPAGQPRPSSPRT